MIIACLLLLAGNAGSPCLLQALSPTSTQAPSEPAQLRERAWTLDVSQLPTASSDRWHDWKPNEPIPPQLSEDYHAAIQAYAQEDLLLAVAYAYSLLQAAPDYPPALLVLAAAHYRLQRYSAAILCYERFLQHAPHGLSRTRQLGHCYHALGQTQAAIDHYSKLLQTSREDGRLLRSRAVAYLRHGVPNNALADIQAALKRLPGDAEALYWHAAILFELEDKLGHEAAIQARQADPFSARAWFLVAQFEFESDAAGSQKAGKEAQERFEQLRDAETSIRVWQRELYAQPGHLEAAENIARAHLGVGDLDRAKSAYVRLQTSARSQNRQAWYAKATRAIAGIEKADSPR